MSTGSTRTGRVPLPSWTKQWARSPRCDLVAFPSLPQPEFNEGRLSAVLDGQHAYHRFEKSADIHIYRYSQLAHQPTAP